MSEKKKRILTNVLWFVIPLLIILTAVFVIKRELGPTIVSGSSMEPNFHDGQICITEEPKNLQRGDVVIIETDRTNTLIKRVIGLPGETVNMIGGKGYINGKKLKDIVDVKANHEGILLGEGVTLKEGEYICLGDNRNNSADSRDYGAFTTEEIKRRVLQ